MPELRPLEENAMDGPETLWPTPGRHYNVTVAYDGDEGLLVLDAPPEVDYYLGESACRAYPEEVLDAPEGHEPGVYSIRYVFSCATTYEGECEAGFSRVSQKKLWGMGAGKTVPQVSPFSPPYPYWLKHWLLTSFRLYDWMLGKEHKQAPSPLTPYPVLPIHELFGRLPEAVYYHVPLDDESHDAGRRRGYILPALGGKLGVFQSRLESAGLVKLVGIVGTKKGMGLTPTDHLVNVLRAWLNTPRGEGKR